MPERLSDLLAEIHACRVCAPAFDHEPRPVLQAGRGARLAIFGQAPGVRAHARGRPFADPSGDRLRAWLGLDEDVFYDAERVAVVPMGFCFPGLNARRADLPPRPECAPLWRRRVLAAMPNLRVAVLVGAYAQKWHLGAAASPTLTATVADWRAFAPAAFPVPHPSWRNNAWLKKNPWFDKDLLPALRAQVRSALDP